MQTGDLFAVQDAASREDRRESIRQCLWDTFGWPGPAVGRMCEIDIPIPPTPEGGSLYCYMETARLIELKADGRWLAEIEMPGDWYKNGRRVLLDRDYIGPDRRQFKHRRMTTGGGSDG